MKTTNFFYETGIDITNDKQMFDFLKRHFTYYTMNSWNYERSIANKVKINSLGLEGDCWRALAFLEADDYCTVNDMIHEWEEEYPAYRVGFNGRSGGYLVLYNDNNYCSVLPEAVADYDTYEEYKEYCREYGYGSVKAHRDELRDAVRIVQAFDKLCDEIRAYVNQLSLTSFETGKLEEAVERFNDIYFKDLETMYYDYLEVKDGKVDISEIKQLRCLLEAFIEVAQDVIGQTGYEIIIDNDNLLYICEK